MWDPRTSQNLSKPLRKDLRAREGVQEPGMGSTAQQDTFVVSKEYLSPGLDFSRDTE